MKYILVYAKGRKDKKFKALSSLENLTYAFSLMYAIRIPYNKLERIKLWCDKMNDSCIKNGVQIELRHYKGNAIYKVG